VSKKKRLSLTERYLKELHVKFIEVLKYNPDFWEGLAFSLSAGLGGTEEAKLSLRIIIEQHDSFESLLNAFSHWPYDKYMLYFMLTGCFAVDNEHLLAAFVDPLQRIRNEEGLPDGNPGLNIVFNMRYENALLSGLVDVILGHYYEPIYKVDPCWRNIYDDSDWVLETLFAYPFLMKVRVNLSAGKIKIRKAVRELLEKLSPRETEPTPRLRPDTWELRYQVYYLYREEGLSFEEIAPTVGKSYQRVQSLYMEAYEYLHQEDYGTKRTRGETDVKLSERSFVPLEDAENMYTKMQLLGAGSTHFSKQEWDDQKGTITTPPLVREKYRLCQECKVTPGTEGCWGCITWKNSTSFHGNMEGVPYFRRIFLPPTYPGTGYKGYPEFDYVKVGHQKRLILRDWRWWRFFEQMAVTWGYSCVDGIIGKREFQEGLTREEELSLQAGYISQNGVTLLDPHEAPKPPKGRKMEIIASSASQYSLAFTLRPDLLEWLIVIQIDQRAKKSHHN
jgi:hypothetical protein